MAAQPKYFCAVAEIMHCQDRGIEQCTGCAEKKIVIPDVVEISEERRTALDHENDERGGYQCDLQPQKIED